MLYARPLTRRDVLKASAAALALAPLAASAQGAYPARPVRVVIPYPPAGGADTVGLQEDHDAADRFLFAPAFADPLDALRADALDLAQERGAFVDDGQGALAEGLDDLAPFSAKEFADAIAGIA